MSNKGKQSESKRRDDTYDLEQQFILRLPPGQAMALSHELDSGGNLKDNLFIDINPDSRWGSVRYGGEVINAKVVDLPTTIETLKTTDNKTFYKTADICQMLIASNDLEPSDEESESPKKKKEKEKKYHYLHGLCPPLKNVRRRRFRKTLRKKPIDLASIEKEVKRLLRMDLEAIDVKYEEVADDGTPGETSGEGTSKTKSQKKSAAAAEEQLDEEKLFGEISSSSGEEETEDVNIDDDSDTEQLNITPIKQGTSPAAHSFRMEDDESMDGDTSVTRRLSEINIKLSALERSITNQKSDIRKTQNSDLKRRFEAVLDDLTSEKAELLAEKQRLEST